MKRSIACWRRSVFHLSRRERGGVPLAALGVRREGRAHSPSCSSASRLLAALRGPSRSIPMGSRRDGHLPRASASPPGPAWRPFLVEATPLGGATQRRKGEAADGGKRLREVRGYLGETRFVPEGRPEGGVPIVRREFLGHPYRFTFGNRRRAMCETNANGPGERLAVEDQVLCQGGLIVVVLHGV